MDPYLEARWSDVNVSVIAYLREAIQPLLPKDLRARAEERVLLETTGGERLAAYRSDIATVRTGRRESARNATPETVVVEPVLVDVHSSLEVDRFVQIVDIRNGNRVVTAIEILSPGNKSSGLFNEAYRRKLSDYVVGEVNVVEVDLLRSPRGRLEIGQQDLPDDRRAPYLTCVRRATRPGRWEVYPMPLRSPLPAVPVPLRANEPDLVLALQPLVERVYTAGGHDDIDYRRPADPPLEADDAAWADQLLRSAGRR